MSGDAPPWTDEVDDPTGSVRWRLSTAVLLLAVLYLLVAALAAFLTAEDVANDLAVSAVQVLGVGMLLRLLEYATGDRLRVAFVEVSRVARTALERVGSWARIQEVPGRPDGGDGGDRGAYLSAEDVRESVRLAALLTFLGGILLVVAWWGDPTRVVSGSYLGAWVFGLGLLAAVYVALSEGR